MKTLASLIAGGVLLAQTQAPPQFRSGVDLIQLDVSVLDKNRQPVTDLGPSDFTILEDGKPQTISVFSAVVVPDAAPPKAAWMRDVAPEVRTNAGLGEQRLFVIIIDDAAIQDNPFALKNVKDSARRVIDGFGPSDLAAVIFTLDNRNSQDFTSDRARLLAAVNTFKPGARGGGMDTLMLGYSVGVLQGSVKTLATLPDRRKSIVYIGQGIPLSLGMAAGLPGPVVPMFDDGARLDQGFMSDLMHRLDETFRAAERANVTVYALDVCGLRPPRSPVRPTCEPGLEVEYLQNIAAVTGGKAIVNTNDFAPGIAAMFQENSSYYLLGYQSANTALDGKLREIEVLVNQPNLLVRTRSGYVSDREADAKRKAEADKAPLGAALRGIVPKGDLPMQLMAAPFAIPGKKESAVAVMLGVHQPIRETGTRTVEEVDFLVGAYDVDGKGYGARRMHAKVTIRPDAKGLAFYEALARLDLKPGRYQLRMAGTVGSIATSGSLYYDVDVPDFRSAAVSLSGLVLVANPAPAVAPKDALTPVVPVLPTTKRDFRRDELAMAFVRVYQGGKSTLTSVPVRIQIRNEDDLLVMDRRETLGPAMFRTDRSADVNVLLPINRLVSGAYLLTIEAAVGKTTAMRQLRFQVTK